jgi:hypothetical protein
MEPDQVIEAVMTRIRRKKIWQKAKTIVDKFGLVRRHEESCYTTERGNFKIIFGERETLEITTESFGQFHENLELKVIFNGQLVFEAIRTSWPEKYDQRRVLKIKGKAYHPDVAIQKFQDGTWIEFLNFSRIRKILHPKPKKGKKVAVKRREDATNIARDLGIELD